MFSPQSSPGTASCGSRLHRKSRDLIEQPMPRVAVLTGSQSDVPLLEPCLQTLAELGIEHELHVMSAHRSPAKVQEFASTAAERGFEVIIAAAGMAAHLPGVVAAWTALPVIGVPVRKPGGVGA